ncbi:transmembrane protein 106B-like [Ptychodera flava]|uniref:transmembrane protein 106B-like n=1 Tax=Ptychodera flava TaxID=63121 RepID=UPI00396A8257
MSLRNPSSSSALGTPSSPSVNKEDGGSGSGGSSTEYRYEELHDGLTCPTCQGTGRIPRGQEESLVALIPYSDKRLRPRRTALYVAIAVSISLIAASLLIFFLLPREVTLAIDKAETVDVKLNASANYLWLNIKNTFNITNKNYVSASLNSLTVEALYRNTIRGTLSKKIGKTIGLQESTQIFSELNVTFTENDASVVVYICDPKKQISHNLLIKFQVTLETSYLSHTEEVTVTNDFFVPCVLSKSRRRR